MIWQDNNWVDWFFLLQHNFWIGQQSILKDVGADTRLRKESVTRTSPIKLTFFHFSLHRILHQRWWYNTIDHYVRKTTTTAKELEPGFFALAKKQRGQTKH